MVDQEVAESGWRKSLTRLIDGIALLACLSIVLGWLGRWHFLLDLASHFRLQATIVFVVAAIGWRLVGRVNCSRFAAGVAGACFVLLLPYFDVGSSSDTSEYRLLLMNVLTHNPQKAEVMAQIDKSDPDFIVLLETDEDWVAICESELSGRWPHRKTVPRPDNFGIVLYSKIPFRKCEVQRSLEWGVTPSIRAEFESADDRFILWAVHPIPPMSGDAFEARNRLLELVSERVANSRPESTLLAGDLNCTPWSPCFQAFCRKADLRNSMLGHGLGISWTPFASQILGLPLDHVLVGSAVSVVDRQVGKPLGSDHRCIVVDFDVSQ